MLRWDLSLRAKLAGSLGWTQDRIPGIVRSVRGLSSWSRLISFGDCSESKKFLQMLVAYYNQHDEPLRFTLAEFDAWLPRYDGTLKTILIGTIRKSNCQLR
jgi:hypothetical protein